MFKIRQDKRITNKSTFLALGVNTYGQKELMGMWIAENEGAKFWLSVLTELNQRGVPSNQRRKQEMDDAHSKLASGYESVYYRVRGTSRKAR